MKRRTRIVAAAAGLLLCLGAGAARGQSARPDPKAILTEMTARYARLSSYQDTGVVQTLAGESLPGAPAVRFPDASYAGETIVSFKTFYARPRMFRFEWRSYKPAASREAAVWSDGRKSYGWMPSLSSGDESFVLEGGQELRDYVGAAQRSSSGAAFFVPSLLMKELDPMPFGELLGHMDGLSVVREEQFDGEVCHVVGGKIGGTPWLLWVGKESRLLRKTRTVYTSGSFHDMVEGKKVKTTIAEEIHRDIRVNERLPPATFKLRPRLGERDIDLTR